MRRLLIVTPLLLLALAGTWVLNSHVTRADAGATQSVTAATAPAIVYALDATGAVIAPSGGSLRLSMPASTPVTWFTDPPARRAGSIRLSELAGVWTASGFVEDPPNAALQTIDNGIERTSVVEMTKPQVARGRVSFAIRQVRKGKEAGRRHTHHPTAGSFARARMFIDDAALSPCPATIGSTARIAPTTPTVYQCLLAPGASTTFSWLSASIGYSLVTACSTASTFQYIPNYLYGTSTTSKVPGPVCTSTSGTTTDPLVVSRGFATPVNPTDGTPNCPTPPGNSWSFSLPSTAPGALRITVQDGKNLVCPQITMITTIKASATPAVGPGS